MTTEPTQTHMGRLLRAYGVTTAFSIREAAIRTKLSKETIARHLRDDGEPPRMLREPNLMKLAEGLGIPPDLLKDAMMADINYGRVVSSSSIATVLGQIVQLSADELADLQAEIARMQLARSDGNGHRRGRSSVHPRVEDSARDGYVPEGEVLHGPFGETGDHWAAMADPPRV